MSQEVEQYRQELRTLTFNSKPIINSLTMIAGDSLHIAEGIVDAISQRILGAPIPEKLPSLYLMDSICKNIQGDYINLFERRVVELFCSVFDTADPKTRESLKKLLGTWPPVFTKASCDKLYYYIENAVGGRFGAALRRPSHFNSPLLRSLPSWQQQQQQRNPRQWPPADDRGRQPPPHQQHLSNAVPLRSRQPLPLPIPQGRYDNYRDPLPPQVRNDPYMDPRMTPLMDTRLSQPLGPSNGGVGMPYLQDDYKYRYPDPVLSRPLGGADYPPIAAVPHYPPQPPIPVPLSRYPVSLPLPGQIPLPYQADYLHPGNVALPPGLPLSVTPTVNSALGGFNPLDQLQLTNEAIKQRYAGAVETLYHNLPKQCQSCGFRYENSETGSRELQEHLDWHFRKNRREREKTGRVTRDWYLSLDTWKTFKLTGDAIDHVSGFQTETKVEEEVEQELPSCEAPEDGPPDDGICKICKEKLEKFMDLESEEWRWMAAVRVDGKTYHALCYQHSGSGSKRRLEDSNDPNGTKKLRS